MDKRIKTARSIANLKKGRNDWYSITDKVQFKDEYGGETGAEIYIYEEIGYFGVTASDFVRDLKAVESDKILLRVNCPGGDVFDGLAIYNALKNFAGKVTAVIDGIAASAASFIVCAADEVVIARNAQMMIHDAHGVAIGLNATKMQAMVALLEKNSDNIADIYAQKAGGTADQWRTAMKAETWYLGQEAVDAGLADRVEGETKKAVEDSWDLSIFNYAGRAEAPTPQVVNKEPEFTFNPELFREAMKEAACPHQ